MKSIIYAPTGNGIPVIQLSTSYPATLSIQSHHIKATHKVINASLLIYRTKIARVGLWRKELPWGFKEMICGERALEALE
jgi:hypothetical protein